MRLTIPAISIALAMMASAAVIRAQNTAPPQNPSPITVGMMVKDPQEGMVGTVTAMNGDLVTVKTDKHAVQLPRASFRVSGDHVLVGMTQSQLNATIEQQLAAAQAKIALGAKVVGLQGTLVGTIETLDDQYATLKLTSGKLIKLQRSALGAAPEGARIGMTAAALEAQVATTAAATTSSTE